jgi:hypothetical protein
MDGKPRQQRLRTTAARQRHRLAVHLHLELPEHPNTDHAQC